MMVKLALLFNWVLLSEYPGWCFYVSCLCTDSSLTVKDVVKEFQPGGRHAQHKHGEVGQNFKHCWVWEYEDKMTASRLDFHLNPQCVDRAGFCLFLKSYLEVEDFPSDFCQRLYRYFQHVEQGDPITRGKWVYPAIMLQTTETHTVSTSLSFRRRLSSWCVLLLLSAGGWTAKRQARMCFFPNFLHCFVMSLMHLIDISLLRPDLKKVRVKKINHCLSLICF